MRRATVTSAGAIFSINISIHALLAESDHRPAKSGLGRPIFLSTLSLRRATHDEAVFSVKHRHFYPRSPCGERPLLPLCYNRPSDFYPRSPCGERRFHFNAGQHICVISIHALLAESDAAAGEHRGRTQISIHALLAESDVRCRVGSVRPSNFYPRSPCGERLFLSVSSASAWQFLSTLSLRRATIVLDLFNFHEPNFYPRSPCGERPGQRRSSCAR